MKLKIWHTIRKSVFKRPGNVAGYKLTAMKKATRSNVRMYDAVRTILEAHQTAWSENQPFVAGVEKFNTLFEELKTLTLKHGTIVSGIKTKRSVYLDELIQKAMVLRDGLRVFAFENKLYSISEKLDFSASKLKYATQLELRNYIITIYELIVEHESEVVVYGVSSQNILDFMDKFEDFEKEIVAVRKGTIDRKFVTARIAELEAEIKILFDKKLDVLARLIAVEHSEFFSSYKAARILIEQKRSTANVSPHPDDGSPDIGIAS